MQCPACGLENTDAARFCQACGGPLQAAFATPVTPVATGGGSGKAVASLVLGIVGLGAWCIPLIGLPVSIIGLVLGIRALKSPSRGMAIAGIVLAILGLVATVIYAAVGVYLFTSGQHPLLKLFQPQGESLQ